MPLNHGKRNTGSPAVCIHCYKCNPKIEKDEFNSINPIKSLSNKLIADVASMFYLVVITNLLNNVKY